MQHFGRSVSPYWRRVLAMAIDYGVGIGLLAILWPWLPDSPPTHVPSMGLYTDQQFVNYFTLVGIVCLIPIINGLLVFISPWRGTFGHLIAQIELTPLDSQTSRVWALVRRTVRTIGGLLFLCIPGPLIALFIAIIVSVVFGIPFSTGDRMLRTIGTPDWQRLSLHALSFVLLFIALWYVVIRPTVNALRKRFFLAENGLTPRDYATASTYVLRN